MVRGVVFREVETEWEAPVNGKVKDRGHVAAVPVAKAPMVRDPNAPSGPSSSAAIRGIDGVPA